MAELAPQAPGEPGRTEACVGLTLRGSLCGWGLPRARETRLLLLGPVPCGVACVCVCVLLCQGQLPARAQLCHLLHSPLLAANWPFPEMYVTLLG